VPLRRRRTAGIRAAPPKHESMVLYIVLGVVAVVLFAGWRLDRKDRAGKGRSRKAAGMTRDAMRYREQYRRKAGR
jgi:hypothetical protein